MRRYCAAQERCHSEVRNKLLKMHVYGDELEEIMAQLVRDDFLNEERYARSFARGKFRMNHWGRFKIRMHLRQKGVSDFSIKQGLSEIDDEEYRAWLTKKVSTTLDNTEDFKSRVKLINSLIRKGFERELIQEIVDQHR